MLGLKVAKSSRNHLKILMMMTNSEMSRSDILVSPVTSNEDGEMSSARGCEFHAVDLGDPVLELEMKFPNILMFREAVKVFNLKIGTDITFKK